MMIQINLPLESLEPMFSALSIIKPNHCTRMENRALQLLKSSIYFELEKIMETEEEKYEREINFKRLFHEEREKRKHEYSEREDSELIGDVK